MLIQFEFSGFRSFRDQALLDFSREDDAGHEDRVMKGAQGSGILPIISIHGQTGGGKSNVLRALSYLKAMITRHEVMTAMGGSGDGMVPERYRGPQHFLFRKDASSFPTVFSVLFRNGGFDFRYILTLRNEEIEKEELWYRKTGMPDDSLLFGRTGDDTVTGPSLDIGPVSRLSRKVPLISFIALTFMASPVTAAYDWFRSIDVLDCDASEDLTRLPEDGSREKEQLLRLLGQFDVSIRDYSVLRDIDGNIASIRTMHEVDGESYGLDLADESSGTRKLLCSLGIIRESLSGGHLLVADDLDRSLNPSVLRKIMRLYTDPEINRNGAQLLMTAHDVLSMDRSVLRPDEIWFSAMGADNASTLHSLSSFRSRKETGSGEWRQEYLEGRYGADPFLESPSPEEIG